MESNHDAHIHFTDEPILGHKTIDPIGTYTQYFKENNIRTAFIVFSDAEKFGKFKKECKTSCPNTDIYGFYWIHDFDDYIIPEIADALKTESFIDNTDISKMDSVLTADRRNLPIYIHCGEINSELANPLLVKDLAERFKDRKFIIGHSGAYGPP
ncbi:MAG: hypothetical protein GQ477_00690, partial [Nanohaloarchaea archaeon]|nr:hypothetical protein [Candidatus Nanohaloarchaea archaeon]